MSPACRSFEPLLSAYQDDECSPAKRRALEMHLSACPGCAARLADLKTTCAAVQEALTARADAVDFSGFARSVLARVTPAPEPWRTRLRVALSEILFYRRVAIATAVATAVLVLGVGGPLIWRMARQAARNEAMVRAIETDNPRLTPVVMQTDDGKTMVLFVEHAPAEDEAEGPPPGLPRPDAPRGGDL